jgi:predicted transcriptional regulator
VKDIRQMRELVGLSQIALSHRAQVSRMRLQLAEAGELQLRPEELLALRKAIGERAASLQSELLERGFVRMAV